ncbi:hypothetical protein [Luteithermobacter gelatinilyticus]|uniref:hypothetical protein n=1 Tax=Luteithermobacter gelatinilyticus TaxID=2582913 RepID=UPI001105D782|nr:hypothetical protein [Luteithermobacter gelatinilyticus]
MPALVLRLLARKLDEKALFQVVWGIYAIAAVLCSLTLSGASYIFIIPLLGAVLAAVVLSFRQPQSSLKVKVACYVGSALAAYMAFYHFMLLDVVVNFHMSHLKVIPLLLLSLAALPLMLTWRQAGSDHGLLVGTGLVAALATLAASMMPAYTPERPRSTNIIYRADVSSGTYQWQLFTYGPDDRHYLQKADFPDEKFPYHDFGYKPRTGYLKPAPDLKLEAPGFTLISDTTEGKIRIITATLHYGRNAMLSGIGFPPEMKLHTLEVSGQRVLEAPNSAAPHALFMGSDPEGLPMRLTVEAGTAVEFRIFDMTPLSITGEAATLHALRPANTAPMHFGDHSIVSRTINLGE